MSLTKYFETYHQTGHNPHKNTNALQSNTSEDNFTIYLRIKPILANPLQTQSLRILNSHEVEVLPPYFSTDCERVFRYSQVFDQKASNSQVFNKTMLKPIKNVLCGHNSTVFIYGMTGAGKTHTMFHNIQTEEQPQNQGLVGLALSKIFEDIKKQTTSKFKITLSFYEIYNENIRDLLAEGAATLNIMEDPLKGVVINELVYLQIRTAEQARKAVQQGMNRRAINATKNNQASSRSHAILQFTIRHYTPKKTPGEVELRQSKLFLVDLAGNEKACHGQNKRFVEGVNINKSLLTLGKCISILAQQKKTAFIPFRDSKLTRILKDSLGGNSKTVMIACVSCENRFYEQTLNTLKYSTKAKRIKNSNTGGSTRMVSSRQMPIDILNESKSSNEVYVNNFVTNLQQILKQKLKIGNIRDQLTECYQMNQKQSKNNPSNDVFISNMRQICNLLLKLSQKQNTIDAKLQQTINKFTCQAQKKKQILHKQFKELQSCTDKPHPEIQHLLNAQQYSQKNNTNQSQQSPSTALIDLTQSRPLQSKSNKQECPQGNTPSCLSRKDSFILISQNSNHSENKFRNRVSINLASCKNASDKQNIMTNTSKRSDSSKSLALSLVNKTQQIHHKNTPQNTIDLSVQLIKLKSPQIRDAPNNKSFASPNNIPANKQNDFLVRLKDMDKNSSNYSKASIGNLLVEFDQMGYSIGKMERSMINKLRFMFKNKQKQLHSNTTSTNLRTRDKSVGRL